MWYMAFPARLVFVIGEPIDVPAVVREEGITDLEQPHRDRLRRVAERVRKQMQTELSQLTELHGRRPWQVNTLVQQLRQTRGRWGRILPWGWPLAFVREERNHQRPPARSRLHAILRDWDLIGFYLPLGWPLLSLARAFRRPPCGYRGLSRAETRERQGNFLWRLREHPLPPRNSSPTAAPVAPSTGRTTAPPEPRGKVGASQPVP